MSFSFETLEFSRLLELVARNAQTPMGAERILELRPFVSRLELDAALDVISETIALNEEKQVSWSFSGLEDPSESIAILHIRNAALEPLRLLDLAQIAAQAIFTRSLLQPEKEFAPTLWQFVELIPPTLLSVSDQINKKILPGGEIDDSASPELAKLRREINAQRQRLTRSLESAMRAAGNAIQDAIVTVRNDRFVIPVKSDHRGKVSGVAHGISSSGSTTFIEPLEAIEANNELQNLRAQEEREVSRILFNLTEQLREHLPSIEAAAETIAKLDAIKVKVEFARAFNAVVPEISDSNTLALTDARHPLLSEPPASAGDRSAEGFSFPSTSAVGTDRPPANAGGSDWIVPNSFSLTTDRSVMIISGANAGGKTVVLKTAGLLSLMAISGLPVPAKEAKVPFYRSVLADIGDHQSLSANLSTFSSHMSNIARMIRECHSPALVMLDEAGTGTDPEEGSALGVAIVDHFRRNCQAHVIASTHYRGLKMYAANDESIINASVEFDERTLRPTYKLLIGLAGASSGIEIARRFGILPEVIDAARTELDTSARQAEEYLQRLQSETRQAEDLRKALEDEREAVAMKFAALEIDAVKKEKARQKEFESQLAEAVDAFDRRSAAFLKTIEDKALRTRLDKERAARKAELNRAVVAKVNRSEPHASAGEQFANYDPTHRPHADARGSDIVVGSKVLTSFGKLGLIQRIDGDIAQVLVGSVHLREKLKDLRLSEPPASASGKKPASITTDVNDESRTADAELNLIGMTTADAEYELDRFIDEAYMARNPRVRIIHGFGTGALKNYVHHFLKTSDLIERFEFAPSNQGGNGATIAELRL